MIGKTFIDNDDLFLKYGLYITEGGYDSLLAFPPLKKIDTNDWQEEDGIEADLSTPTLDSREVTIPMTAGNGNDIAGFFAAISDGAYHVFNFAEIGQTYTLRLVLEVRRETVGSTITTALTFCDDFPLKDYTYQAPTDAGLPDGDYSLNGVNFADYGITALQGTSDEFKKTPQTKQNLTINLNNASGVYYDPELVTYKAKDIALKLLMAANSVEVFWQNYKAFLYDITRAGIRLITKQSEIFPCFYTSTTGSRVSIYGNKTVAELAVKMTCLSYRNPEQYLTLITEGGNPIITQSGQLIDVGAFQNYGLATIGVKVSDLPEATTTDGLFVLGYDPATNRSLKIPAYLLGTGTGGTPTTLDGGNVATNAQQMDCGNAASISTNSINGGNSTN